MTHDQPLTSLSPARAAQHLIAGAVRASGLHTAARLIMLTLADIAAEAAEIGAPFALSLDQLAEETTLSHQMVARQIEALIITGWIVRPAGGDWHLAVGPTRTMDGPA